MAGLVEKLTLNLGHYITIQISEELKRIITIKGNIMKNLTVVGLSSRFEGLKLKWIPHTKGNWMIVEALKNFDFDNVEKATLVF